MSRSRKLIVLIILLLVGYGVAEAQNYTIRGTIRALSSGETLISAAVYDQQSGKGALTNAEGRYSLTLPKGKVVLRISYVGYKTFYDTIDLSKNEELNVWLESSTTLQTVTVRADRISSHRSSQMSAIDVPVENIKSVPVLFGETDVLKALQLLPGVQSGTEGMSGIYVRGGGPDQNLFLLDGQFAVAGVVLLLFNKRLAFLKFIVVTELGDFVAIPLIVKIVKSTPASLIVRILFLHAIP